MSSSKGRRHTHKYYRVELTTGQYVWACGHADCPHHMPKHYERMLLGKNFECFECGKESTLRKEHLSLDKSYFVNGDLEHPRCLDCVQGIAAVDIDEEFLDNLLKKAGKQ